MSSARQLWLNVKCGQDLTGAAGQVVGGPVGDVLPVVDALGIDPNIVARATIPIAYTGLAAGVLPIAGAIGGSIGALNPGRYSRLRAAARGVVTGIGTGMGGLIGSAAPLFASTFAKNPPSLGTHALLQLLGIGGGAAAGNMLTRYVLGPDDPLPQKPPRRKV